MPLEKFCLPPLVRQFEKQIAARGHLNMAWNLKEFKSVRVVSHLASMLGDDHPDTAYRQAIIRLESVQSLTIREWKKAHRPANVQRPLSDLKWVPEAAKTKAVEEVQMEEVGYDDTFVENGELKTVVEYLVLQTRVIRGSAKDWKVWGFTEETTPEQLVADQVYWKNMLNSQTAWGV